MKPIRWGVLGASKFAREYMGPAIHAADGAELAAVASRSIEKLAPFQAFAPHCQAEESYEALLANPSIDAVYIPLPHPMHTPWALKSANAGKAVLVEKPAGMVAADIDALIAKRDETGLLIAEAYMIVHHPQWQRVKSLIDDGAIGQVTHISGCFTYDNRADTGNIRNKAETGGGGLRDIGVYVFGSARYAMGADPEIDHARVRFESGFDVFADVHARFPNGATYSAYVSTRMLPAQEMVFHGTEGMIRVKVPFNARVFGEAELEIHQPGGAVRCERFPRDDQYKLQVEAFGHALRDGVKYPCPLEFSRGTQVMIDKVLEIAKPLDTLAQT